ncbi:MAG: hypothetical protein WA951_03355 [Leeuwenhoekiella sp.]
MRTRYQIITRVMALPILVFLWVSCTTEQQDKTGNKEGISEKIAALNTTIVQKEALTAREKSMLKQITTKYDKASVTVGEQNRSFIFDDLSRDHIEFNAIDKVPVFPSCSGSDRKAESDCVEDKIAKFVTDNFNISAGKNLEVSGIHEIDVSFIIDTDGAVRDIKTRYAEKSLEDEAKRVIALLPKMRPGAHKGKTMAALYSLPIQFKVP